MTLNLGYTTPAVIKRGRRHDRAQGDDRRVRGMRR
jgi:hypothetical protein